MGCSLIWLKHKHDGETMQVRILPSQLHVIPVRHAEIIVLNYNHTSVQIKIKSKMCIEIDFKKGQNSDKLIHRLSELNYYKNKKVYEKCKL